MLKNIYAWTMALAARKSAVWWLAIVAFVESSVFVVPADVLFLPMVLAKPKRRCFMRSSQRSLPFSVALPAGFSATMLSRVSRGQF